MEEMSRDRRILHMYADYCGKKVIYDPYDDPIMKKKMEIYERELRSFKKRLILSVTLVILVISLLSYLFYSIGGLDTDITLMFLLLIGMAITFMSFVYLPAKDQYNIKMEKYLLLEDAIMYYLRYRPKELPNPLIIPFSDIREISSKTRPSGHEVISIKLKGESKGISKNIEGSVSIFEECVPDIDLFYDMLKKQIDKWRGERNAKGAEDSGQ